jgi:hypothetical protein
MRLVIYETTHYENLPAMLELAQFFFEQTTVFLDESSYQNLIPAGEAETCWAHVLFIIRRKNINHRKFIRTLLDYIRKEKFTHLHLSSLSNNYLFFVWNLNLFTNLHISLTVHEINYFRSLSFRSVRGISESFAKWWLYRKIDGLRALIPQMKIELDEYFPETKTVFIPSRFYIPNYFIPSADPVKIIVPGTVDARRRDYNFLVEFVYNQMSKTNYKQRLSIILLGNAGSDFGKNIQQRLQKANDFIKIIFYQDEVSPEEYSKEWQDASIIWSPIRTVTTGSRGQAEVYGISKSPGITADLIRFPKPTLVPEDFKIPFYLKHCLIPYKGGPDLLQKMTGLINQDKTALTQDIKKDISALVKENFSKDFEKLMQSG